MQGCFLPDFQAFINMKNYKTLTCFFLGNYMQPIQAGFSYGPGSPNQFFSPHVHYGNPDVVSNQREWYVPG